MDLFGKNKEQRIIDLFQKGNPYAMDELYGEYADYLAGVCVRYIPNKDDLHDVLQEGFIKIFTNIASFEYRGKGSLKAWVTRVMINEALLFIRAREADIFSDKEVEPMGVVAEDPQLDKLTEDEILSLIAQLPTGYRTVFNLYVIEEKSHKEIAELLNIKADTSASQLHKAKAMLAKMINTYKKEQDL